MGLMGNSTTFSFMLWPYQSINGLLSVRSRWCAVKKRLSVLTMSHMHFRMNLHSEV